MEKEQIEIMDELLMKLFRTVKIGNNLFDKNGNMCNLKMNNGIRIEVENYWKEHMPSVLYRFRDATDYNLKNLQENTIWLSTLRELNDPFEDRIYIDFKAIADDAIEHDGDAKTLLPNKEIREKHPAYIKYINERKMGNRKLQEELLMKRDRVFVASFSENRKSLLMWAHYADSHKGFCIGYSKNDLISTYGALNLLPINYSNNFLRINSWSDFIGHHEMLLKAAKTKSKEWEYEKEWRLLTYEINSPYRKGIIVETPNPCVVYMGVNIESDIKKQITEICKKKNIDLYQMAISEKGYRLISYKINI